MFDAWAGEFAVRGGDVGIGFGFCSSVSSQT